MSASTTRTVDLSIVIPCYNESAVIELLHQRLSSALKELAITWETIFIDDGSADSTYDQLVALNQGDPRFKVIRFSRNFGHQAAISAGLEFACGEAVAIMDADLQDPPEILPGALRKLKEGYDVVYAIRRKRKESLGKRFAYASFYRILKLVAEVDIPLDSGDFCLMRRQVVRTLRGMPERNVFLRGMRAWAGFRQIGIEYERDARAAGETKYPLKKLVRLATDGVFAFSTLPLRLATALGFLVLACSIVGALFVLAWRVIGFRFMGHSAHELPGWAAVVGGMLFLGGVQLLLLGCLGEYIGRIYTEVKQRPRWIVRETVGLETEADRKVEDRS